MTTLTEAVEALAGVIDTIPDLRVTDHVPDVTEYPAAFIEPPLIEYDRLDDAGGVFDIDVILLVGTELGRHQKKLLPWMWGTGSIQATLQANRSLGRSDVDAHATRARPMGLEEMASYQAFGAVVTVRIHIG